MRVILKTDDQTFIGDLDTADVEGGTWRLKNAAFVDEHGNISQPSQFISGRFMRWFAKVDESPAEEPAKESLCIGKLTDEG